jgi:hypothetical protein
MNVFKSLDAIFPQLPDRHFGEVVSVDIRVFVDNVDLGEIIMKRKAWYVNASVNAFHMHRSLVRDFTNLVRGLNLSQQQIRRAKRLISLAVLVGYLDNRENERQYHEYFLHVNTPPSGSVSLWWNANEKSGDWREVKDQLLSLQTQVDLSVLALTQRMDLPKADKERPLECEEVSSVGSDES